MITEYQSAPQINQFKIKPSPCYQHYQASILSDAV